jgi:predicted solute-binding protein
MYKFAVLPYVNAAPLVHFLPDVCPGAELIYHTPRKTLSELTAGRVNAAIVPVVDYLDTPELDMIEGLGICADGNVESVLLQCQCPLDEVEIVNLDPASKTSNLLVQLLLKRHFSVRQQIHFRYGALNADACVMIGDRALSADRAMETYDLAAEWKKMTGLPFVFAVWVCRTDRTDKQELSEILRAAKKAGCKAMGWLSKLYAKKVGLTETRCRHYLTTSLHYDLGPNEKNGMQLFRELYTSLLQTHRQTIKEESIQTRRIVPNERKSHIIEPVGPRLR